MGEVFITRKGGGGKAAAPTIAVTEVGGSWVEFEITNNDAAPNGATIFVLVNYDPTSETDFDLQASQNGFVFAVAQGATVTQLVTGLDPDTSHTVSAQAAVIKKLLSSIVTTDTINLAGTGVTAPTVGPIVSDTFVGANTTLTITVANSDTTLPLVIKANFTTSTTPPTTYPFETASLAAGASTNLTLTGLTTLTTFYIHARAFDGAFSSSNVVFGPYTTDGPLYDFTTWTFTNAGVTGQNGPNITQVRSAYSSQSWAQNNDYLSMTTNGIQNWTVPASGSYRIEAFGAGAQVRQGGRGARMRGDFTLTQGEVIRILVGQHPIPFNTSHGGAAGGTFVVRNPYNTNASIAVIAGGGGGGHNGGTQASDHGQTGTSGGNGRTSGAGGTNGNGGAGQQGSGGGGFVGNGGTGQTGGGRSFVNGGVGAANGTNFGGFGGGGAQGNSHGGGGGGYSGGGGTSNSPYQGGGGGSYNNGTNQSNSAGVRDNNGQVIITKL